MKLHRLVCALSLVLLLAGSLCSYAQTRVPTWPQQFSVKSGESATFAFPVTQPGQVTVDVTWQGAPLTVALAPQSGSPVASVNGKSSPVKLIYAVTSTDIQKGILWAVKITAPGAVGASTQPVATGQVTVQAPPANLQAVLALENSLRQSIRSRTIFPTRIPPLAARLERTVTDPDASTDHAVLDINAYDPSPVSFTKVNVTKNDDYWQVSQTVPGQIDAVHVSEMFIGGKASDRYFSGVVLKNGWTVEEVVFTPSGKVMFSNAEIKPGDSHLGTSNASVTVSWWVEHPLNVLTYTLQVKVKGPKGTSWK